MYTARNPPVDPAPAAIIAALAMHTGHISFSLKNQLAARGKTQKYVIPNPVPFLNGVRNLLFPRFSWEQQIPQPQTTRIRDDKSDFFRSLLGGFSPLHESRWLIGTRSPACRHWHIQHPQINAELSAVLVPVIQHDVAQKLSAGHGQ
jgi:hypothetical protein